MSENSWNKSERLVALTEFRKSMIAISDMALENLEQDDEQLWCDT
jgi:hypothetical protein